MDVANLVEETTLFPIIAKLQECLCSELGKAGGPALCYCGVFIGDLAPLAMMDCSKECGAAWVRPVTAFPSSAFPVPADPTASRCGSPLAMTLEVGVARCAPRAPRGALYPNPQDMFNALRLYMSDMKAALRAISCCMKGQRGVEYSLGDWTPLPVQGGISGGVWTVTVA